MAGFVNFIGWLAFVAGLATIGLPFVAPDWISLDTTISLCVFLLVTGPMLIGLSQLIGVAGRIQENTSWFSTGLPAGEQKPVEAQEQPQPAAEPQDTVETVPDAADETPTPADETPPPEAPCAPAEQPADQPAPQLYDANRHPAAVEEWSHQGRRVMTLEDGTFATEVSGAWYRFVRLEDIESVGR